MRVETVQRTTVARRRAGGSDIPLLRELFADAHVELAVLPADTRFVLVDMQFRAQRQQWARQHPHAVQQILERGGVPVGQIVIDTHHDHVRVVDLSVGLGHRRTGVATAALREVCSGTAPVRVEMWAGNVAGRALCSAAGFTVVGDDGEVVTFSSEA